MLLAFVAFFDVAKLVSCTFKRRNKKKSYKEKDFICLVFRIRYNFALFMRNRMFWEKEIVLDEGAAEHIDAHGSFRRSFKVKCI